MTERVAIDVVGAIILRGDTVFAARRNPDRSAGGLWEFPGGKVEPGESHRDALVRELAEELGVIATVEDEIAASTVTVGATVLTLTCYRTVLGSADPVSSSDHDALAWIPLKELDRYEWAPGDVPIIAELPEILRGHSARDDKI